MYYLKTVKLYYSALHNTNLYNVVVENILLITQVAKLAFSATIRREIIPNIADAINHFVLKAADIYEDELLSKPKVHYLTHLPTNLGRSWTFS